MSLQSRNPSSLLCCPRHSPHRAYKDVLSALRHWGLLIGDLFLKGRPRQRDHMTTLCRNIGTANREALISQRRAA